MDVFSGVVCRCMTVHRYYEVDFFLLEDLSETQGTGIILSYVQFTAFLMVRTGGIPLVPLYRVKSRFERLFSKYKSE